MSDENTTTGNGVPTTTVTMVSHTTGELVELEVPAHVAEGWQRSWPSAGRGWPVRRFSADDAIAMLRARIDQIDAHRGDMVAANPWLKSV